MCSDWLDGEVTTYTATAEVSRISWLDDFTGGTAEFRQDVETRARVEVYLEGEVQPLTENFEPGYGAESVACLAKEYLEEVATEPNEPPVREVRVTFEFAGLGVSYEVHDEKEQEVCSDYVDYTLAVDYEAPVFVSDLFTAAHTDALEEYLDNKRGEAERIIEARFAEVLTKTFYCAW